MRIKNFKQALLFIALLAFGASFTSCNKGYGCPNNFKVQKTVVKAATTAVKIIVKD